MRDPAAPLASREADATMVAGGAAVTVGLLVLGVSSYGFLALAARGLDPAAFSAVSVTWSLVYALVGVFAPLEQETTRAVALRRLRGHSVLPVVRRAAALGVGASVALALLLLAFAGPLSRRLLGGHLSLVLALTVTLLATGGMYICRGALAGTGRYRAYGAQLAVEGLLRVAAAGVLVASAHATAGRLGAVLAAAAVVALAASLPWLPRAGGRPAPAPWREVTGNLAWLVLASAVAQVVANAGPAVLTLLAPDDPHLAGRFLAAFVIVRIPLFFVSALQAALLPRLVRSVEDGDRHGYLRALSQVLAVVASLGAIAVTGLALLGPWAVSALLGDGDSLPRLDLLLLGASSILFVAAAVLQAAVMAVGGHRAVALTWASGGVAFAILCLVPLAPVTRLDVAYLVTGVLVTALLLREVSRRAPGGAARPPASALNR